MFEINSFRPEAVFSDGTELFRSPCEPEAFDNVVLRIRVGASEVTGVSLCVLAEQSEPDAAVDSCGEEDDAVTKELYPMVLHHTDELFDWYEYRLGLGDRAVSYVFRLEISEKELLYDRKGIVYDDRELYPFVVTPGFHTPEWAKGAVMYQIFVDRFCNGDPSNDVQTNEYYYIDRNVQRVSDWNRYPDKMDVQAFYGGDLAGIMKKLDYLQELGVEVLYLNPIFVSPSNHKYDIQDYDYVDPHYGVIIKDNPKGLPPDHPINAHSQQFITRVTSLENLEASNKLFIQLVEEIHRRGMKVILDGVFNHCGSFNKWLDRECIYEHAEGFEKGAFVDKDSPYHTFFDFTEEDWPYNNNYDGWWDHKTLPKLNYEASDKLKDYIMRIARKWVSPPYNADGWRLDVAADLGHSPEYNHAFWKEFRQNVKEANPNALILAEHYGDAGEWLKGDEWDSVMNYDAFMEPVTWFFTGMQKHSDAFSYDMLCNERAFADAMEHYMTRFQTSSLQVAMNELSNHDHSRFLTRTNRTPGRTATAGPEAAGYGVNRAVMREAVMMQMTWPGAPTVYYGDEAGVCGWTDPDNRRAYPWGREDKEMIAFHKELIRLRRSYQVLRTGSLVKLSAEHGILSYARMDEKDVMVVAFNNNPEERRVRIPAWKAGITDSKSIVRLLYTNKSGFYPDAKIYHAHEGYIELYMPAESGIVLKNAEF